MEKVCWRYGIVLAAVTIPPTLLLLLLLGTKTIAPNPPKNPRNRSLNLRRFRAAMLSAGLARSTASQYVYFARAFLRSAGVSCEADLPRVSREAVRTYLHDAPPSSQRFARAALRRLGEYLAVHGYNLVVPAGTVTSWGVVPDDASRAWRRVSRLLVEDGLDPEAVPWWTVGYGGDALYLDADEAGILGPTAGFVAYGGALGPIRVLHRWACETAPGGDPGGWPASPSALLRCAALGERPAAPAATAATAALELREEPPSQSPEDWNEALAPIGRP